MLRIVDWRLVAQVSGEPVGPIFKSQAVQEDFMDCSYFVIARIYSFILFNMIHNEEH
jgi:hypothetical protein